MIIALWVITAAASVTYAAVLELAGHATARDAAPAYALLAVAAWLILARHHNRRHR